jgi:hypothetical protein
MKLKKLPQKGWESLDGRFHFIMRECLASRSGCYRKAWHLLDNGKLASDQFEDSLNDCKQIAESILEEENEHKKECEILLKEIVIILENCSVYPITEHLADLIKQAKLLTN